MKDVDEDVLRPRSELQDVEAFVREDLQPLVLRKTNLHTDIYRNINYVRVDHSLIIKTREIFPLIIDYIIKSDTTKKIV